MYTAAYSYNISINIRDLLWYSFQELTPLLTIALIATTGVPRAPPEAVLAQNGACALAEAARDAGEDALLMLDLEQSFKASRRGH